MSIEALAYWAAFAIPLILLVTMGVIRKVIEGGDFKREHWYLGVDLTIYFLASCLVNLLDLVRTAQANGRSMIWTVLLTVTAVVMLIVQTGLHQSWVPKTQRRTMQIVVLCGVANALGILLLYGFVRLKTKGTI